MKITKHSADKYGIIIIKNVTRLLTMGIHKNIVTIWAVTDDSPVPNGSTLPFMKFVVRLDGDLVTSKNCQEYITSFINDEGIWHLFQEQNKIIPATGTP